MQHQDHGFNSQQMHELIKGITNARLIALDKSVCLLHKKWLMNMQNINRVNKCLLHETLMVVPNSRNMNMQSEAVVDVCSHLS